LIKFGLPLPYHRFCTVKSHEGLKPKNVKLQGQNPKRKFYRRKTGNDLY